MNRTLLRLSTQALFGRRRGVVLLLIAGALLALAVLVRAAHRRRGRARGRGRARLHAGPAARRAARRHGRARPRDRRRLGRLPARQAGEPARHRGQQVRRGVGRHHAARRAPGGSSRPWCSTRRSPARPLAWAVGGAVAGTVYTALFLALAALTRHAVVVGLLFVLRLGGPARLGLSPASAGCRSGRGAGRSPAVSAPVEDAATTASRTPSWPRCSSPPARSGSPATGCARSPCAATSSSRRGRASRVAPPVRASCAPGTQLGGTGAQLEWWQDGRRIEPTPAPPAAA